ncbi:TPA: hypothetical protein CPT96_07755 [Candidatus Gastranaerophilales bacterium HUM_10]|jgi:hypothetical protein|nr:MAG TPA: hypothetical protein CPT96_07755 [Candidatus Gastranaerophilales bacterium HUM_10]
MKKILIVFLCLLFFAPAFAVNDVSFIYINGSNNNDEKMKNWYEEGVRKLHPVLRKKFEKNSVIKKYYSSLGGLNVSSEPVIFFWGDKSEKDLAFVKSQLDVSKAISSTGAYIARSLIAQYMHDAIWVQKSHNMVPILEELNTYVKEQSAEGNDVILYGYSAGTFITYEYLFNKLRYINPEKLFESLKMDDEFLAYVRENPKKNTCISALSYSYAGIGTVSETGQIILNQDREKLKSNYLTLDEQTELACAPDKRLKGIVNFASPLVLFYSDLADSDYELNYYNKLMTKYIFENGIFWITVNFREDPLGFPTSRNLTVNEIQDRLDMQIENPSGVIYDDSSVWSRRLFAFAHTSYWSARGTFSKAVVKSFINGYKFQYDPKYQAKVLKRKSKKAEL